MGISIEELQANVDDVSRASVMSLQGFGETPIDDILPTRAPSPEERVEQREKVGYLVDAVAELPERLRAVVEGYFFAERPMAEIALELGVTESRVSQMRAEALVLMKEAMNRALDAGSGHRARAPRRCCRPSPRGLLRRGRVPAYGDGPARPDRPGRLRPLRLTRQKKLRPTPQAGNGRADQHPDGAQGRTPRSDPHSRREIIMGLRINQNIDAINSYRNLSVTQGQMSKSLEKLSSGFRINRAADDAAGLAISEGLRSQVGGLKVAVRNAQDGISVAQTAEGALTEVHSMLQRMNDLSVQHANGTQNAESKAALAAGVHRSRDRDRPDQGQHQVQRCRPVRPGRRHGLPGGLCQHATRSRSRRTDSRRLHRREPRWPRVDITDSNTLQAAVTEVSTQRAELGAMQNRFEHTINNLNVAVENLSASESRIRDTDMAAEMMNFTRSQILSQAGTAMLAQANQAPQGVLQLLR